MADIPSTYEPLLLGALVAFGLTGVVGLQCVLYFKLFPRDPFWTKLMVCAAWLLDALHSAFIGETLIYYFITHFGDTKHIDDIPWSISLTVVVTAMQTVLVHCFFAEKILRSSQNNWYITGLVIFLTMCRLISGCVSTAELIRIGSYYQFIHSYPRWIFTTGLSLSAFADVFITVWLTYFLREFRSRTGSTVMIKVVDTLTIYTIETGALTCITTGVSLICWLTMPDNLIFFGIHFVIAKLYANSLLTSLNMRKELWSIRAMRASSYTTAGPMAPTTISHLTGTSEIDCTGLSDPSEVHSPIQKSQCLLESTSDCDQSLGATTSNNKRLTQFSRRPVTSERHTSVMFAV